MPTKSWSYIHFTLCNSHMQSHTNLKCKLALMNHGALLNKIPHSLYVWSKLINNRRLRFVHWSQLSQKHNEMPFSLFTCRDDSFSYMLSLKICDEYLFQDICIHMGCIKSDCRLFVRLVIVIDHIRGITGAPFLFYLYTKRILHNTLLWHRETWY